MAQQNPAFDLRESQLKGRWSRWQDVASWLSNELDLAMSARSGRREEIALSWAYYEQARMRAGSSPWPDAADLPSPFAAEYTDAVHARLLQTIFVEPMWTVEGNAASAQRAPFVEEFHQRAQEDERLQLYLDEWMLRGLIEGVGILKVTDGLTWRREKVTKRVALQLDPASGQPMLGEQGPMLARDDAQQFVPVEDDQTPSSEVEMDELRPARIGPDYEVVPYLDFFTLPGHARHKGHVWAYASRFYRRPPELEAAARRGIYDRKTVADLSTVNDLTTTTADLPISTVTVVDQQQNTAQKELFEIMALLDLDGQGERWWVLTLHKETRVLLRAKTDDGATRYMRFLPFPKPGTIDHGYSLVGNKLISVIEEDTARRNMKADRMALKNGTPILRRQGALWDPLADPFGPRAVIDVRDYDELRAMQGIEDVPPSLMAWGPELRADADRLVGGNEPAMGVATTEQRTLGEVQLRAGYAEVRINVIVKRMQEPLEELGLARHASWKRALATNPQLPPTRAMIVGREAGGIDAAGYPQEVQVTAQLLEGVFWFKPRGSVETADLNRQKQDLIGLLQVLGPLMQMNPAIGMILSTIPAAKAIMEQVIRVFRWPDKQSFLGPVAGGVFEQMQQQQEMQQMEQQLLGDPRMRVVMALMGGASGQMAPGGPTQPSAPQPGAQVPAA